MNQQIEDKIVLRVLARFNERSQVGINKYNTTLERTDLSTLEWLTHAQEEAMDFVLYLERLKDEYKNQQHESIERQVKILKDALDEMMTGFDSEEDRMDFILDICNGYKKRIETKQEEQ
jgi:Na+/phosphate symporter